MGSIQDATGKRKIHGSHEGIEYRRCIGTRCISAPSFPLIPPRWRGGVESERRRLILSVRVNVSLYRPNVDVYGYRCARGNVGPDSGRFQANDYRTGLY